MIFTTDSIKPSECADLIFEKCKQLRHTKSLLVTALILALMTFSVVSKTSLSDKEISKHMIGTWVDDTRNQDFGMLGHITTYYSDGSLAFKGFIDSNCTNQFITAKGDWNVKDKKLLLIVTESNNLEIFPIGLTTDDDVINIDESELVLEDSSGETYYRAKSEICLRTD